MFQTGAYRPREQQRESLQMGFLIVLFGDLLGQSNRMGSIFDDDLDVPWARYTALQASNHFPKQCLLQEHPGKIPSTKQTSD